MRMTAGNSNAFEPTNINDMINVKSLDYNKAYPEFNYDKYIDRFKQSNFVGGKSSTASKRGSEKKKLTNKMNNLIKNMYLDYIKGKTSILKKMKTQKGMRGGATNDEADVFISTMKELKDVSHLNYKDPYQYNEMPTISRMPRSNFQSLGEN